MKSSELRGLPLDELNEKLDGTIKGLYHMRVSATMKELKKSSDIKATRRDIARMKHVIADKQLEAQTAPATK